MLYTFISTTEFSTVLDMLVIKMRTGILSYAKIKVFKNVSLGIQLF